MTVLLCVALINHITHDAVIAFLKTIFARHGVPCELISDNSPQFASSADFAKEWGFQHITSSPHYPRSNGLAESSVKVVKGLMKKALHGKEDFHHSLMIYRSAPLQNGLSPAQMLMGRCLRTNLPMHENLLTSKKLRELRPGKHVRIRDHVTGIWDMHGTMQKEVAPRSSDRAWRVSEKKPCRSHATNVKPDRGGTARHNT
uniref:Integrase catalytic domain-containing protein n=1 Tax=Cynoglossus semilaevis TaxID=244447 RepID=A0A3P8VXA7_CYNSE